MWHAENGFARSGGERERKRERAMAAEIEGELNRGRGQKNSHLCMCPVSGPPYFRRTQINGGAIAFSKRTADGPINEGRGIRIQPDTALAVSSNAVPAVSRIQHLLLHSHTAFNTCDSSAREVLGVGAL